ncbi:Fungal lipase-like domain [Dillenia turbinata]|uniref:Fungal lipase-like domain n=1 Tax=Dillenia turbinata TaxID=194707 RepID=A0AAN8VD39_9MAGN
MREVKRLVQKYKEKGQQVSLTITGHSLGGALALLNAYEAAQSIPGPSISIISFGVPRVGNNAFRDELKQLGVKTLHIVVNQNIVPKTPGIFFDENLEKLEDLMGTLEWIYIHVRTELKLDIRSMPYLDRGLNLVGFHSLENYLRLVDGCISTTSSFHRDARRDIALVNKACDMLAHE